MRPIRYLTPEIRTRHLTAGYGIRITPYDEEIDQQAFYEKHCGKILDNTPFVLVNIQDNMEGIGEEALLLMIRDGLVNDFVVNLEHFLREFPVLADFGEGIDEGLDFVRDFAFIEHDDWRFYVGQMLF